MKPNSTWYANLQRIRILMMSVISGQEIMQFICFNLNKSIRSLQKGKKKRKENMREI